jgi:hypothetical protein
VARPYSLRYARGKAFNGIAITPGFDSTKPVNRWFTFDINVRGPISRGKYSTFRIKSTSHVSLAKENGTILHAQPAIRHIGYLRTVVPRDIWMDGAKKYCQMYYWGGRQEQAMMAPATQQKNTDVKHRHERRIYTLKRSLAPSRVRSICSDPHAQTSIYNLHHSSASSHHHHLPSSICTRTSAIHASPPMPSRSSQAQKDNLSEERSHISVDPGAIPKQPKRRHAPPIRPLGSRMGT